MKNFKKILSIVMVLVMVFAMTATAFATNSGVTVNVLMYGDSTEPYISQTISAAEIAGYAQGASHLYSTTGASSSVPSIGYTAADALYGAWYKSNNGIAPDSDQVNIGWDNNPEEGLPGAYFTVYDGMSADAGTYYYVGMTADGKYEYYWRGDSWNLYIDGNLATAYATSYAVSNISSVVFDYNTTRSDNFTLTYYMQCPNASEDPYNN